jgi:periplasmic protein TonB
MAFDAYRTQGQSPAKKRRRITYALSAIFHGGLIALGVVYSFWHVDELTPPTLRVTFMSAAPPPPPPPPPPAGGGAPKKKITVKPKVTPTPVIPKPTDIVQPRETPAPVKRTVRKHDDEEEDEDEDTPGVRGGQKGGVAGGVIGGAIGGTIGGTKGGVIGGTIGGTGAPVASKFLPPNMGALQKESGADPPFPPSLRRGDMVYVVQVKICVTRAGAVESVTLAKKADPLLDDSVVSTVKTWHYRPLMANNIAVPFCYFGRFEFKSTR